MGTYVFVHSEDFIEHTLKHEINSGTSCYGCFSLFCMWSVVLQSLTLIYISLYVCVCTSAHTRLTLFPFFEKFIVVVFLHLINGIYNSFKFFSETGATK